MYSEKHLETLSRQNELIEAASLESQKQLESILDELQETRQAQERARDDQVEQQCLETLRTTDYEILRKRNVIPDPSPGTCEWIKVHPQYQNWLKHSIPALLWITADPGCGKSVLAKTLVQEFVQTIGVASHVCYFFFRAGTETASVIAALCAILHQLFSQSQELLQRHGLTQYHRNGTKLATFLEPLWEAFFNVCRDPDRDDFLLIVDALDECDAAIDLISRIAEMLGDEEHRPKVRILITSRPELNLKHAFITKSHEYDYSLIRLQGEDKAEVSILRNEINIMIAHQLGRFEEDRKAFGIVDDAHELIDKEIRAFEHQTYLWVAIIFVELRAKASARKDRLLKILTNLPHNVTEAYRKCLDRIPSANLLTAQTVLRLIVGASRDLTLAELKVASTIQQDGSFEQFEEDVHDSSDVVSLEMRAFGDEIRQLCGLLVRIDGVDVTLIHQTAREFLNKSLASLDGAHKEGGRKVCNDAYLNNCLAKSCIWYLTAPSFDVDWIERNAKGNWKAPKRLPLTRYISKHHFLKYAANHWMLHLKGADDLVNEELYFGAAKLCDPHSARYRTWTKIYWESFSRRPPKTTTSLSIAASFDLLPLMNYMIQHGHDINLQDEDGDTALHAAAIYECPEAAKILLKYHADTKLKDLLGNTPLHTAAARGVSTMVKLLLAGDHNANNLNAELKTPLHRAAQFGHAEAVKLLIPMTSNINAQDSRGRTALHLTALMGTEDIKRDSAFRLYDSQNVDDLLDQAKSALPESQPLIIHKARKSNFGRTEDRYARVGDILKRAGASTSIEDHRGETTDMLAFKATMSVLQRSTRSKMPKKFLRLEQKESEKQMFESIQNIKH